MSRIICDICSGNNIEIGSKIVYPYKCSECDEIMNICYVCYLYRRRMEFKSKEVTTCRCNVCERDKKIEDICLT